jgi:hypothetical protein
MGSSRAADVPYHTVQFRSNRQSRVTHPPVDHELWSRSRVTQASGEPPSGHTCPKLPKINKIKRQKRPKFRFKCRNFQGVTQRFGRCQNVEQVKWVTCHTPCRFERNCTVVSTSFLPLVTPLSVHSAAFIFAVSP